MYQVDLAHEHERGTGKNRHHELALECDRYKERIVQYENDVNTLTHQVQRLQEASDKARAELEESVQKYEEKSRQKRKFVRDVHGAQAEGGESRSALLACATVTANACSLSRTVVAAAAAAPAGGSNGDYATARRSGALRRAKRCVGLVRRCGDSAPFGVQQPVASRRVSGCRVVGARDRFTAKSPRLSLDHSSVHHLDKFSALRSDFAKRARSPLSSIAAISMPPQQQQQHQAAPPPPPQVQQPPLQPQQSRMPLAM